MLQSIWNILQGLAPWLLLGTAIAGALHVFLGPEFIHRHLGGRHAVLKAVALGVPLPLCSCGIIPTGLGLKKDGASNGAVVGFFISTPQTGVDSMLVSASFLGWPFAIFKVITALITGLLGGWITDAVTPREASEGGAAHEKTAHAHRWKEALSFSLEILRSIWPWLLFGVLLSAAIECFVPQSFFAKVNEFGTLGAALVALVISLPMYVCATASIPIAAALVAAGMPTGAALVFLMAGPASNLATIGAVYRGLGLKILLIYLGTLVVGSLGGAMLFEQIFGGVHSGHAHLHDHSNPIAMIATCAFIALMIYFMIDAIRTKIQHWQQEKQQAAGPLTEIHLEGVHCENCVRKIERRLSQMEGVHQVKASVSGWVKVYGEIEREQLEQAAIEIGFKPAEDA